MLLNSRVILKCCLAHTTFVYVINRPSNYHIVYEFPILSQIPHTTCIRTHFFRYFVKVYIRLNNFLRLTHFYILYSSNSILLIIISSFPHLLTFSSDPLQPATAVPPHLARAPPITKHLRPYRIANLLHLPVPAFLSPVVAVSHTAMSSH